MKLVGPCFNFIFKIQVLARTWIEFFKFLLQKAAIVSGAQRLGDLLALKEKGF
jgi:hypothetical protein